MHLCQVSSDGHIQHAQMCSSWNGTQRLVLVKAFSLLLLRLLQSCCKQEPHCLCLTVISLENKAEWRIEVIPAPQPGELVLPMGKPTTYLIEYSRLFSSPQPT